MLAEISVAALTGADRDPESRGAEFEHQFGGVDVLGNPVHGPFLPCQAIALLGRRARGGHI
jgi:hypothetical protein